MSPRKGTCHSGNGGGRELQALLDSAVVPIADKDDAAGQIPWRTSRRLQESTFRSLCKERDVDSSSVKKEKVSPEALSVRSLKRLRSPPSPTTPLELCRTEDLEDREGSAESCPHHENWKKGTIVHGGTSPSKRKKRTVHFADPLVFYIEDKIQEEGGCGKPATETKSAQHSRNENRGLPKSAAGTRNQPKLPMSCFDLLCNYSGAKGWKCYRSCIEGESFCSYHLSNRKAAEPSILRISVCT